MTDPDRLTEARADTDSGKLRLLADWFDATRPNEPTEVQDDLRRIADDLDAAALRSTPEAGSARVIPPPSDEARARQPDSCWADCGDHDWYCCGGEWDDPERREAIFAGSDAALRSTDHPMRVAEPGLAACLESLKTAEGVDDEGAADLQRAADILRGSTEGGPSAYEQGHHDGYADAVKDVRKRCGAGGGE